MKLTREVQTTVRIEGEVDVGFAAIYLWVGDKRYTTWFVSEFLGRAKAEAALIEKMDRIEKELRGAPASKDTPEDAP